MVSANQVELQNLCSAEEGLSVDAPGVALLCNLYRGPKVNDRTLTSKVHNDEDLWLWVSMKESVTQ